RRDHLAALEPAAVRGFDALDLAGLDQQAPGWGRQMDLAAQLFDRRREGRDQRLGAALDVAQFLLEQRAARATEPLDPLPDPGRRDALGVLVEFQLEQRAPELVVDSRPAPGAEPVGGADPV